MNERRLSSEEPAAEVRQLLSALVVTLISVGMLLGSFLLARLDISPGPSALTRAVAQRSTITPFLPTLTPQPSPTVLATPDQATSPPVEEATPAEEATYSPTPTVAEFQVPPPTPAPTRTRPPGWLIYTVRRGDTLDELARRARTTTLTLMRGNDLDTMVLFPGQHLYVPPAFYATPTPEPYPCGPPLHWVVYRVQAGDTLFSLSRRFNIGLEALRRANCLRTYTIRAGDMLFVPPSTPTPWPTATPTALPSPSRTATPTPIPTATSGPPSTSTPTSSPTVSPPPATPTPSSTSTQMPASTATPSRTPTTASPTATSTLIPTPTETPAPEPTSTWTPTLQPTPTQTPTPQPVPTQTSTLQPTPTQTPTPQPRPTQTPTSPAAAAEPPTHLGG